MITIRYFAGSAAAAGRDAETLPNADPVDAQP